MKKTILTIGTIVVAILIAAFILLALNKRRKKRLSEEENLNIDNNGNIIPNANIEVEIPDNSIIAANPNINDNADGVSDVNTLL